MTHTIFSAYPAPLREIIQPYIAQEFPMSKKSQVKHMEEVKTALADKYERLARTRKSKPARATLLRHSKRFRSQAANAAKGNSK